VVVAVHDVAIVNEDEWLAVKHGVHKLPEIQPPLPEHDLLAGLREHQPVLHANQRRHQGDARPEVGVTDTDDVFDLGEFRFCFHG